jgi:hypothetical protein
LGGGIDNGHGFTANGIAPLAIDQKLDVLVGLHWIGLCHSRSLIAGKEIG